MAEKKILKEKKNNNKIKNDNKNKRVVLIVVGLLLIVTITFGVTYAFFNYTRTGPNNVVETGYVFFNYVEGNSINLTNQFPIGESELTNNHKLTFDITAHNTLTNGVAFNVYAIPGDADPDRARLADDIMKIKFEAPSDGDGFTITNNCVTGTTPIYTDGKMLLATGLVKNTVANTTKTYSVYLWVDDELAFVSSTTKRENNLEGNPSLADATAGNTTAVRYMKNNSETKTVTLYPANSDSAGKIIYTTNEFSNSYYSIKIVLEAYDVKASQS